MINEFSQEPNQVQDVALRVFGLLSIYFNVNPTRHSTFAELGIGELGKMSLERLIEAEFNIDLDGIDLDLDEIENLETLVFAMAEVNQAVVIDFTHGLDAFAAV